MIKKIILVTLIVLVLFAAALVGAANWIQNKAPEYLRDAIERSLNKKVLIQSIEYYFPRTFKLQGFEVREKGQPFDGETSFYVDRVELNLSPLVFSKKALIISVLEIQDAQIVVRKFGGRIYHPLSGVMVSTPKKNGAVASGKSGLLKAVTESLPLEINLLELKNCHFKYADYDIQSNGFVMTFDKINARIKNVGFPASGRKTVYDIHFELVQERDERRAKVSFSGWIFPDTLDANAALSMTGVHLPYLSPYYAQVTQAAIEDGYTDVRAVLKMDKRVLDVSAGFEFSGLLFQSYEAEDQLFGLKAEEVLSFLKDSSGRLRFQIAVNWNTADRTVKLKEVFRRSIERSLRETVLGNVGNLIINALQAVGEAQSGGPGKKANVEDKIKKIKDFFKY